MKCNLPILGIQDKDKLWEKLDKFASGNSPATILAEYKELMEDKHKPGYMKYIYFFVFLGRNGGDNSYACVNVYYTAEIRLTNELTLGGTPFLWGLLQSANEENYREFFLYKALDGLVRNGIIKNIKYVE